MDSQLGIFKFHFQFDSILHFHLNTKRLLFFGSSKKKIFSIMWVVIGTAILLRQQQGRYLVTSY